MYYFTLGGTDCRCDTAKELQAIVGESTAPKAIDANPTAAKVATAIHREMRRATRAKAAEEPTAVVAEPQTSVERLPYLEGPLSWKTVKRIGKKLGRSDFMQLRSELKQRKDEGR